jgi:hypothetical protein
MPPHIIKDLPPKRIETKPKHWHPWQEEVERRERVEKQNALANILAVNAVVASEDEEDGLD